MVSGQLGMAEQPQVAPGAYKAGGGSQQTIVPNRSLWTEPKPLGKIGGGK
jgi:hypothetical protein